jgi:maltose O-acetyltransferase
MLAAEMYDPFDPELVAAREHARNLCQPLNATREPHLHAGEHQH